MYFGDNDEIDSNIRLDIDCDKDIVMFDKHEMDNKSRKNVASYLRDRISGQEYRFKKGIYVDQDEVLEIALTDEDIDFNNIDSLCIGDLEFKRKRFKDVYRDIHMFMVIKNGDDSFFLKEGDRYLSREESCHMIDLIDKSGNITFSVDTDVWIKIQKS